MPHVQCKVCGLGFETDSSSRKKLVGPCCQHLSKKEALEKRLALLESEWVPGEDGKPFRSFRPFSHELASWKCNPCGWEWESSWTNRSAGNGCPACAGKVVTPWNNLAVQCPEAAALWDYEKNEGLTPQNVSAGSHKAAYFRCAHGHSYPRPIYSVAANRGCKFCSQVATPGRNLALLHPLLAEEWHPTLNKDLTPDRVLPGSNQAVWWKCRFGHQWKAVVGKRVARGDGCPHCWTKASLVQIRTFAELRSVFPSVQFEEKVLGHEVDIWIPEFHFGIEVDGSPWHLSRAAQDQRKSQALGSAGFQLLRFRDSRLPPFLEDRSVPFAYPMTKPMVDRLFQLILEAVPGLPEALRNKLAAYQDYPAFRAEETYRELCATRNFSRLGCSLAEKFPAIAAEWDQERNAPLTPSNFLPGSNQVAWFRCPAPDCGHSYQARIDHRTKSQSGCPYCAGQKTDPKKSLGALHPALVEELHPTKNGNFDPFQILPQSNKKLWWACPACGHGYQAPPNRRVGGLKALGRYRGCKKCYHNRRRCPSVTPATGSL